MGEDVFGPVGRRLEYQRVPDSFETLSCDQLGLVVALLLWVV